MKEWKRVIISLLAVSMLLPAPGTVVSAKKDSAAKVSFSKPATKTLVLKKGSRYKTSINMQNVSGGSVVYKATGSAVSVNGSGVLKARKNGRSKVTVFLKGKQNIKSVITVKVGTPVKKVTMERTSIVLSAGEKASLNASVLPKKATLKKLVYTSGNTGIATVTKKGVVKGVMEGTTVITVKSADGSGKKKKCTVHVTGSDNGFTVLKGEEKNGLELDAEILRLYFSQGDCETAVTQDIALPAEGSNGSKISWKSSRTDIVSDSGIVTRPETDTEVKLTATLRAGKENITKEFVVTVIRKPENVDKTVTTTLKDIAEMNGLSVSELEAETGEGGYLKHVDGTFSNVEIKSAEDARNSLYGVKNAIGLQELDDTLEVEFVQKDKTGGIYRFAQKYKGYPVYGGFVTVSADAEGKSDGLTADCVVLSGGLEKEVLSAEEAKDKVESMEHLTVTEVSEQKEVYADAEGNARIGYRMYVSSSLLEYETDGEEVPCEYEAVVDAATGEIAYANPVSTSADAMQDMVVSGKDLQGNQRKIRLTSQVKDGVQQYVLYDLIRGIGVYKGTGNIEKMELPGSLIWRRKYSGWTKEEVSAAANIKQTYTYFHDTFGLKSFDGQGTQVRVQINTGIQNNASWNGKENIILLGKGTNNSLKYKKVSLGGSLDLMAHEYTHGVVAAKTSLDMIYFGTPGAINEAYADIFGCFVESDWTGKDDWLIGEDVTKTACLRNISDPEKTGYPSAIGGRFFIDYTSNDWQNYQTNDRCGVHRNSTVISHSAYLMRQYGISMDALQKLWYKSLELGYSQFSDFYDVRRNVLKASKKLGYDEEVRNIIKKAFKETGITKKNCDEDVSYFRKLQTASTRVLTNESSADVKSLILSADTKIMHEDGDRFAFELNYPDVRVYDFNTETGECTESSAVVGYSIRGWNFSAECSNPASLMVEVSKPGYVTTRFYRTDGPSDIDASCGSIILAPEGEESAASGKVFDIETKEVLAGAELTFYAGQNNFGYTDPSGQIYTDSDGAYEVIMNPGVYTVRAKKDGYYDDYFRMDILSGEVMDNQDGYLVQKKSEDEVVARYSLRYEVGEDRISMIIGTGGVTRTCVMQDRKNVLLRMNAEEADSSGQISFYCWNVKYHEIFYHEFTLYGGEKTRRSYFNVDDYHDENEYWHVGDFNIYTESFEQNGTWLHDL